MNSIINCYILCIIIINVQIVATTTGQFSDNEFELTSSFLSSSSSGLTQLFLSFVFKINLLRSILSRFCLRSADRLSQVVSVDTFDSIL